MASTATPASSTSNPPSASNAAPPTNPPITNQVLHIPHPTFTHFLTQIIHLDRTLFVHVTSITRTQALSLLHPNTADSDLTASAGHAALAGNLASDFCLTMSASTPTSYATSTTISSTTPLSPASSISKRIASKLGLPQLLLSLDLPPALSTPTTPHDHTALLALEKAIRDACNYALSLQ